MLRHRVTVFVLPVIVVALTGCGSASPTHLALCQAALRHQTVSSATATTVGGVRALTGGPPSATATATAFKGAKNSAPAAWCWVAGGSNDWTAYAAGPHHQSIQVADYSGLTTAPTGAPEIK